MIELKFSLTLIHSLCLSPFQSACNVNEREKDEGIIYFDGEKIYYEFYEDTILKGINIFQF